MESGLGVCEKLNHTASAQRSKKQRYVLSSEAVIKFLWQIRIILTDLCLSYLKINIRLTLKYLNLTGNTMRKFCYSSAILLLLASSCSNQHDRVRVDGSSTVYPVTEAVAEEYMAEFSSAKLTIGVSGTGGGFKKMLRREVDITNASRPITKKEVAQLKEKNIDFLEFPVAYDGLAIVTHPGNTFIDYITVAELKKIWSPEAQGNITRWNQIRAEWPDEEIHLFGAGTASGTFDYFTEAVVGKARSSRGDYTASEDDNVLVQGVSTDPYALGFFGIEYYLQNKDRLKLIPVDDQNDENGKGPVYPSTETIKDGTYQPLSRPLFVYVLKESLTKETVKSFMDFYLDNVSGLVQDVGYISLSNETYALLNKRLQEQKTGSSFVNLESNVGIKLEEILK